MKSNPTLVCSGAFCRGWLLRGVLLAALTACGGGSGGSSDTGGANSDGSGGGNTELPPDLPPALPPEAVVQSVSHGLVLEGNPGQASVIEFDVTLDKPVQRGVEIAYGVNSTAKSGLDSTGSARGGAACAPGVDYVEPGNAKLNIAVGVSTGKLRVTLCPDSAFEPNETFNLSWSSVGATAATVRGTIVNDDAGGLNGTGANLVLGGLPAFGRDVNPLTRGSADGALGFSFDKSNSACVIDKVTGLSWQRASATGRSFAQLQAEIDAANQGGGLCGRTGWRAPTVNELLSLMDLSQVSGQPLNADAMASTADVMHGDFWSGEQVATGTNNAWIVSFGNGGVSYLSKNPSGILPNVRLVNGGAYTSGNSNASACNDSVRYRDFGDGTVEDNKTGLMWRKCAEGASGALCSDTLPMTFASAADIVARVNAVNAVPVGLGLGYSDWRMPNVKELASLVDRCTTNNLAIDNSLFPNNQSTSYVSATYDANNVQQFWYVDFSGGTVGVSTPLNKYLRLVRAGQ